MDKPRGVQIMKYKLNLEPTIGAPVDGLVMDWTKEPIQYEVVGMPPEEKAQIGRFPPDMGKWRILKTIDGEQRKMEGGGGTKQPKRLGPHSKRSVMTTKD